MSQKSRAQAARRPFKLTPLALALSGLALFPFSPASAQNNVITVDSDRSAEVYGNSTNNGVTRSTDSRSLSDLPEQASMVYDCGVWDNSRHYQFP
ncbi:hypothetical protein FACS189475_00850 [Betaproteobacteria bacterium]|nr:hypothetical protein FACS189475_00850 [Betaproteobacteria bacterium]